MCVGPLCLSKEVKFKTLMKRAFPWRLREKAY